ncbi:MAG: hypothetical protein QOE45_2460 [Frankiaceae bacterium]|jgi:hypothetical protein|nr:hypothetical protein [Frankiaceae bacterium]
MLRKALLTSFVTAALLGAPAAAYANASDCPAGVADTTGTNPTLAGIAGLLDAAAATYDIPPAVLKAIAYRESAWRQYGSDGKVVISSGDDVCGVGIMQVTSTEDPDPARLASDIEYNINAGARILAGKWTTAQATPPDGYPPDDRHITENWYYPVCLYNGCGDVDYPERVAETAADPFRRVPTSLKPYLPMGGFTKPTDVDPSYALPNAFQATPDGHFVFYNASNGDISQVVEAITHDFRVAMPEVAYGAGTYGPDGPAVSCDTCGGWRLAEGAGVSGRAHWTKSILGTTQGTRVTWLPPLPRTGPYRVSAYVPPIGSDTLGHATYHVVSTQVNVDQNAYKGGWAPLGDRTLSPNAAVYLTDLSDLADQKIVADAVRFSMLTAVSMTAPAGAVTYGGSGKALSIRLTHAGAGLTGRTVRLERRAPGAAAWTFAAQGVTGADGRLTLTPHPSANTEYRAVYVTTSDAVGSASGAVRVDVRPAVAASLARTTVPHGSSATVSTSVAPAHAGQQVALQRLYGSQWRGVLSRTLNAAGKASYTFSLPAGTYKFRVYKAPDADHVAAYSVVLTLRVT